MMPTARVLLFVFALCVSVAFAVPAGGAVDLSGAIEGFMAKQFPDARYYFWIVNEAEWQDEDELVVDLKTVVTPRDGQPPAESRFLLLIVEGKLAGAQSVPLEADPDCQPEKVTA